MELVSHLHIHLIPRAAGEKRKSTELFRLLGEVREDNKKAIKVQEAEDFAQRLREAL